MRFLFLSSSELDGERRSRRAEVLLRRDNRAAASRAADGNGSSQGGTAGPGGAAEAGRAIDFHAKRARHRTAAAIHGGVRVDSNARSALAPTVRRRGCAEPGC